MEGIFGELFEHASRDKWDYAQYEKCVVAHKEIEAEIIEMVEHYGNYDSTSGISSEFSEEMYKMYYERLNIHSILNCSTDQIQSYLKELRTQYASEDQLVPWHNNVFLYAEFKSDIQRPYTTVLWAQQRLSEYLKKILILNKYKKIEDGIQNKTLPKQTLATYTEWKQVHQMVINMIQNPPDGVEYRITPHKHFAGYGSVAVNERYRKLETRRLKLKKRFNQAVFGLSRVELHKKRERAEDVSRRIFWEEQEHKQMISKNTEKAQLEKFLTIRGVTNVDVIKRLSTVTTIVHTYMFTDQSLRSKKLVSALEETLDTYYGILADVRFLNNVYLGQNLYANDKDLDEHGTMGIHTFCLQGTDNIVEVKEKMFPIFSSFPTLTTQIKQLVGKTEELLKVDEDGFIKSWSGKESTCDHSYIPTSTFDVVMCAVCKRRQFSLDTPYDVKTFCKLWFVERILVQVPEMIPLLYKWTPGLISIRTMAFVCAAVYDRCTDKLKMKDMGFHILRLNKLLTRDYSQPTQQSVLDTTSDLLDALPINSDDEDVSDDEDAGPSNM